jgi:predicted ATPase
MIFVSREQELHRLTHYLERARAGNGQLCFITGEPGQGKTTLALEFARRAQEAHPDLVTALSVCAPQTGQGDPYLPFRTICSRSSPTRVP